MKNFIPLLTKKFKVKDLSKRFRIEDLIKEKTIKKKLKEGFKILYKKRLINKEDIKDIIKDLLDHNKY